MLIGTAANDIHFQAFLIEGIVRWNSARAEAATDSSTITVYRSFDTSLQDQLHSLSSRVIGAPINPDYRPPSVYTGEKFGIEYLYSESDNSTALGLMEDIDSKVEELEDSFLTDEDFNCSATIEEEYDLELELLHDAFNESLNFVPESMDSRSIPGWDKVSSLAKLLVQSIDLSITQVEASKVVELYERLSDFDKKSLHYYRTFRPSQGRFAGNKSNHVGVEAMKRSFVAAGAPSLPPSKSRIVEAICIYLSIEITAGDKDPYISRYLKIIRRYNLIRERMSCPLIS